MATQAHSIETAAAALRRGQVVVFPTDTVYGLGVAVGAAAGPDTLFDLKQRDRDKPIAWLVADNDDLRRYGRAVPEFAFALARTFWPGPLTLIVRASEEAPEAFRSVEDTVGLRVPANETARALIRAAGSPVATTSANVSGRKAPRSFEELDAGLVSQVAAVVRNGARMSGVASTVLDCTADHPVMIREGAVTIADIQALS